MKEEAFIYKDDAKKMKFILRTAVEGCYIFVYEYDNPVSIRDDLQDSLEIAMEIIEEDYGVPQSSWKTLPLEEL